MCRAGTTIVDKVPDGSTVYQQGVSFAASVGSYGVVRFHHKIRVVHTYSSAVLCICGCVCLICCLCTCVFAVIRIVCLLGRF